MIFSEMGEIVIFSTFRPSRPACRPGGAARLSASEPTLVASDSMLGASHRTLGVSQIATSGPPARDLGATSSRLRGRQFATSGLPVRGLGTSGTGPVLGG